MGYVDKGHRCNEGGGPVRVVSGCSGFHGLGVCELISRDLFEAWLPQASVDRWSLLLSHWNSVVNCLRVDWMSLQVMNEKQGLTPGRFARQPPLLLALPRRLYLWRAMGSAG